MDESVLNDLIKTRNVLKKKYFQLKTGKMMRETELENTFKPIVEPLKKLVGNIKKEESQQEDNIKTPKRRKLHFKSFNEKDEEDHERAESPSLELNSPDNTFLFSTPKNFDSPNKSSSFNQQKLLSESNRDTAYGPYFDANTQSVKIGKCSFKMNDKNIIIDDEIFTRTPGLIELVLKKNPCKQKYTKDDLDQYSKILQKTNAYRMNHDSSSRIKSNRGVKYTQIIKAIVAGLKNDNAKIGKSYSSITEMKYTNKDIEYVYWNDPNELVDRLRLLIASKNAGNDNHQNEITSIIEELKESNIIY